jgi:hypothetical protein
LSRLTGAFIIGPPKPVFLKLTIKVCPPAAFDNEFMALGDKAKGPPKAGAWGHFFQARAINCEIGKSLEKI